VQDGCPSHSSSTQVAYIVRGGSRFKQEKKRLILCKQASKQASKLPTLCTCFSPPIKQRCWLLEPLLPHDENRAGR
jgi:hypothetical protein